MTLLEMLGMTMEMDILFPLNQLIMVSTFVMHCSIPWEILFLIVEKEYEKMNL